MAPTIHRTEKPVVLEGFQSILRPSEYGYTLACLIPDEELLQTLTEEREQLLKVQEDKLKNKKRSSLKPTPWEEVAEGIYKYKFSWDAKNKPTIVDSEGTLITDDSIPIYAGSKVRVAFTQRGYTMKDGITYGTQLRLSGIQVISISSSGVPSLSEEEAANLFGEYEGGFRADDIPDADTAEEEEVEGDTSDESEEQEDKEF